MTGATNRGDSVIDVPVPSPKKVISVKLEVELIEELDRIWRMLGYSSRSEFIREAILYYMQIAVRRIETNKSSPVLEIDENSEADEIL